MRTGVTLDDVTRAADELLGRGERPTVEGVRTVLGTGSPATVNTLLKDYFRALQGRLTLPAPVAQAAADLVATVHATLDAAASEREAARAEVHARAQAELATERAGFEAERQQLRDRLSTLTAELGTQREQATRAEALLEARQAEMALLAGRATAAESRAQAVEDERERASQNHHSEIARLKERADGNERHLLAQINELRDQAKRLQGDREREHQQAAKRHSELESVLANTNAEAGGLAACASTSTSVVCTNHTSHS